MVIILPPWLDVLLDLKYEADLVDVVVHPWDDLDEAHEVLSPIQGPTQN